MSQQRQKILFGLTGSIACYKACELISTLVKANYDVQVVATASALKFVGESTFEGLTGNAVLSDTFARGHAMDHITLARAADLFIVAPLTAHHAALFANGFGDDLLSTLFLAYETHKPLLLVPAMNSVMWQNPAVVQNFAKLRARGIEICEPASGRLACGEEGPGKMREPEDIFEIVQSRLSLRAEATQENILITYGGTREKIDNVRVITNLSTGGTGALLCDEFLRAGYNVTALAATTAKRPEHFEDPHLQTTLFDSHSDLNEALQTVLRQKHFSFVIHLAAVSDYTVSHITVDDKTEKTAKKSKISSEKEVAITLKPTLKLVNVLKKYAQDPKPLVVAFKLTSTSDSKERSVAVTKLLDSAGVDLVVHNDATEIDRAHDHHPFTLYSKIAKPVTFASARELARGLVQLAHFKARGLNAREEELNDTLS